MIKIQQQAAKMTREAVETLLRTSKFIPEDRMDWSSMGSARTVRSQLAECIQYAGAVCFILTAEIVPQDFPRDKWIAQREQILESCKDIPTITELARARYSELYQVIENVPDSRLETEFILPFGGGMTVTGADTLFLAYWNLVYHLGQVNYIQTMLGDMEMH